MWGKCYYEIFSTQNSFKITCIIITQYGSTVYIGIAMGGAAL